jgi:hypothetical protein
MDTITSPGSGLTIEGLRKARALLAADIPRKPTFYRSIAVTEQFRFPRTKKRRIRKKWAMRPENIRPMEKALWDGLRNVFYVHPRSLLCKKMIESGIVFTR